MIYFNCPACDKALRAPDSAIGHRIACGGCQEVAVVPDESEQPIVVAKAPTAPPAPPEPAAPLTDEERAANNRRMMAGFRLLTQIFRASAWGLCIAWTALRVLLFWAADRHAESAIQQAAVAGQACANIIAGYILTRAATFIMREVDQGWWGRNN